MYTLLSVGLVLVALIVLAAYIRLCFKHKQKEGEYFK